MDKIKKINTKGKNLQGGIKASYNLSSIVFPVFFINIFSLLIIKLAIRLLKSIETNTKIKKIK